jgi:hypothetical protein
VSIASADWAGLLRGPRRLYWRLRATNGTDVETLAKGEIEVILT